METAEKTLDEIMNLAAAHFKVPREKLSPDDDFFKALGIDSLQTLDLLTKLENHFHVELPDYELQGVSDFRTLAIEDPGTAVEIACSSAHLVFRCSEHLDANRLMAGGELITKSVSESPCLCGEINR